MTATGTLYFLLAQVPLLDIGLYPVFLALEIAGKPRKIQAMATFDKTGVDSKCSMLFAHDNDVLSVLFSSIITNGRTESIIHGSKGQIGLNREWHIPTSLDILPDNGKAQHFSYKEPGFGYQYEAEEVMNCIDKGKIQSELFSWDKSLDLITTLDAIRSIAGIKYPDELERT